MNQRLEDRLADMAVIQAVETLDYDDRDKVIGKLTCPSSQRYIENVFIIKPETALSTYLFEPTLEAAGAETIPQAAAGDGFVDYLTKSITHNPVAIEVKPLLTRKGAERSRLYKNSLAYEYRKLVSCFESTHENQITKYLKDNEYVLFTNMEEVMFFNRQAISDFKPFSVKSIRDFLESLEASGDIWEYVTRIEDNIEKHDLDKNFYVDLRKWYDILSEVTWLGDEKTAAENKVLLINKLIFVQTLEDYSLIPFKYLRTLYEEKYHLWGTKGIHLFLKRFLEEVDEWFYLYYDTELFKTRILDCIKLTDVNYGRLAKAIKDILGFGLWDATFGRGLTYYNFRYVDEDVFGKAYETFIAENRSEQGIYYTPRLITSYMAEKIVEDTFCPVKDELLETLKTNPIDHDKAKLLTQRLTSIAILDPACGSGSFLIKTLRFIFDVYNDIQEKTSWAEYRTLEELPKDIGKRKDIINEIRYLLGIAEQQDSRKLISLIILRHIYGIDLDERAINVARVNLWKEAIKLRPEAFKFRSLPSGKDHILPALEANLIRANSITTEPEAVWVTLLQEHAEDIITMFRLRGTYLNNPCDASPLEELQKVKHDLRSSLKDALNRLSFDHPLIAPLEFFHIYFDSQGKPIENPGFDGIIGNPPWEAIKPFEKEFAAKHPDIFGEITKFSLDGPTFEILFEKKLKDPDVAELWSEYRNSIKQLYLFIKSRYSLYATGDLTYQKVFLERAIELSCNSVAILVPSNLHSDEGTFKLRTKILHEYCLKELFSFENRNHCWFPDVHPQFKFDMVHFIKKQDGGTFMAKFMVCGWKEIDNKYPYPNTQINLFSPKVWGMREFGGDRDIEISRKIRDNHRLLLEMTYHLAREFHMTDDRNLFNKEKLGLPLYEGKTIYHFDPIYGPLHYWVDKEKGRDRLLAKELKLVKRFLNLAATEMGFPSKRDFKTFVDEQYNRAEAMFNDGRFKLNYENYRLVMRDVAAQTNERSLISCLVPRNVFLGNTLNYLWPSHYIMKEDTLEQEMVSPENFLLLMALMNTFTMDYYIRMRVSSHLNMFILEELPIPSLASNLRSQLIRMALNLIYHSPDYDVLAHSLGLTPEELGPQEWLSTRVKLETMVARDVFGLDKNDMEHILGTFVYGTPNTELMQAILDSM